jgi:hypothetical protein
VLDTLVIVNFQIVLRRRTNSPNIIFALGLEKDFEEFVRNATSIPRREQPILDSNDLTLHIRLGETVSLWRADLYPNEGNPVVYFVEKLTKAKDEFRFESRNARM